jgi:hypothetical protein
MANQPSQHFADKKTANPKVSGNKSSNRQATGLLSVEILSRSGSVRIEKSKVTHPAQSSGSCLTCELCFSARCRVKLNPQQLISSARFRFYAKLTVSMRDNKKTYFSHNAHRLKGCSHGKAKMPDCCIAANDSCHCCITFTGLLGRDFR